MTQGLFLHSGLFGSLGYSGPVLGGPPIYQMTGGRGEEARGAGGGESRDGAPAEGPWQGP